MVRALFRWVALGALLWVALPAHAESLRCTKGSATEGDSRVSVLYKCGEPNFKDSACDDVYYSGSYQPVPDVIGRAYVPCFPVETWIYNRGEGNLVATVKFRSGKVTSIQYSQNPG